MEICDRCQRPVWTSGLHSEIQGDSCMGSGNPKCLEVEDTLLKLRNLRTLQPIPKTPVPPEYPDTVLTLDLGWHGSALVRFRWIDQNNRAREAEVMAFVPPLKSDQAKGLAVRVTPDRELEEKP